MAGPQRSCFISNKPIGAGLAWEHHPSCMSHREEFKDSCSRSLYWDANIFPSIQNRTDLCIKGLWHWDGNTPFFPLCRPIFIFSSTPALFFPTHRQPVPRTLSLWLTVISVLHLPRLASSVAVHLSCRSSFLFCGLITIFWFPGCHRCHLPLSALYLFMANWASTVQLGLCFLTLFVFYWVLKGWFYLLSKTFSLNMLLWPKQFQKLTVIVSSPFPGVPFGLKIQKCLLFKFRYGR